MDLEAGSFGILVVPPSILPRVSLYCLTAVAHSICKATRVEAALNLLEQLRITC
jgi:hypothetical protein